MTKLVNVMVCILVVTVMSCTAVLSYNLGKIISSNRGALALPTPPTPPTPPTLDAQVENMPNSYLKANLLAVLGARDLGQSEELNDVLSEWIHIKLEQRGLR